jgi:Flp pilus assembly protein TadD
MRLRLAQKLFLPTVCIAFPASFLGILPAVAQTPPGPIASANFDPSDVYFQGYLLSRSAEKLEASGDFVGAAEKLKKAAQLFDAVKRFYPTWKSEMVTGRSAQTAEAQAKIASKANEQRRKNKNLVAELEGGEKRSGTLQDPALGDLLSPPSILEVNPLEARRLSEAEAEVKRLQNLLNKPPTPDPEQSRNESRISDLKRQNDYTQSQLRAAETNLQTLRAQLAKNPMEGEVNSLNKRISGLEQEKEAMAMALAQSRSSHTEALSRVATLEADVKVMQQKHANLDRDLKAEREVANSVVAGQRTQLKALTDELSQKNLELGKANARITGLIKELDESKDAFAALRTERDSLLTERDQMSALLKLNEDGRIQDLIQQNMGLAKNLREANDKVERLNLDSNSAKDDTTDALRDLAMAKNQINKIHQEKRDQDKRLEDLESRLKGEDNALATGQAAADPEEANVLREIIRKQLSIQERRRQAKDLLVDAAKAMGTQDERLAQAISLFDSQEIELTPEEQHLIASKQVDGEFISPYARSRDAVGKSTEELKHDIAVMERTAEKSYAAGRLGPTRELFEMIIEQHPGHIPTLCKLGIVDLKLNDPSAAVDKFRRAVELDATNPYAHRMLGFSFMSLGDMPAAELNVKQAVELAPGNANSQLLLGSIFERRGNPQQAECCYKAAIAADPMPSDPYFNLARLFSRGRRLDQARDYYSQALDRGAKPDPSLEQLLVQK